ncbi:D-alanyl-D-alanine carboxypeptidase [Amycolatopsis tolypomycina]|uniref:D-alanyl-D-alanine carboxypeptidase n=1 Tax=Amycolatopsis tolypomycina TaxID=208445 RepID=A0A1H4IFD3_9PSEU|nr:serine hydrolase domain-containing protein [Amycolatopsis tolypomycina]SEB32650.1 D-alanyl-D-alanine carboxypeptidase [Amycolatopsis tolypomycina]
MIKHIAAALLAVTLAGTATPAFAATPGPACVAPEPLDTTALEQAIKGLPNDAVNAALVRATGPDGCWTGTAGVADRRTGTPVHPDARFRIGSVTKVFTAVVVLQLVAEHKIALDGTVQEYLPGLLPAGYPAVTVRQLLDYTNGLPSPVLEDDRIEYIVAHRFDRWTPEQYVAAAFAQGSKEFEPGTAQHYRNIGYIVAGMLVEKVTGRSYESQVRDRIVRPLHLTGTTAPGHDPALHGPHVRGYQIMSDGSVLDVTRWDQSFGWASSSIVSTTRDLDVFTAALFGGRLLPPSVQPELFAVPPVKDVSGKPASYGAGLQRYRLPGVGEVWGKSGGWYGYLAGLGGTRDGRRQLVYGVTANDAKNGDNPTPVTQQIVLAGMTLAARR